MQNYILTIISAALITLGCTQSFILEDNSTPAPKPTPTPELTSAPYAVGDYYNDGTKEGVVFDVWDDGNSGKIVSMTQAGKLQWSSDEAEWKRFVGADNQTDGAVNMAIIKSISGWESKYPAFKWCADLGEGWYLPAKEELLTIYSNKAAIDANLTGQLSSSWYWSSTEYDYHDSDGVFCAWNVNLGNGNTNYYPKGGSLSVRAVSAFGNAKPTPELTSAPYAVGDYYNDGKKEGVVFEVWDDGNSGKIVSMTQSASALQWSSDEAEQKRFVGANSETDGAVNMAIIKAISGWESKYPAFKWCADLGEGWYLPAKEELLTIYSNKDVVNANLVYKVLSSYYWSSTEYDYYNSYGVFCAWFVDMYNGRTDNTAKNANYRVRAVSAFGNAKPTPELTSAPYAVGDYYNDGKKEGVVFEVWDNGNSGKIVSMTQSASTLQWSSDATEQRRLVGADSQTDGAANMAIIKSISGWEDKYPAFKWCADLGEGWYLPAKEELLTIYSNKAAIDANLTGQLSSSVYWSSTEYDYHHSDGVFCAWLVYMYNGTTGNYFKYNLNYVRAVSAFGNAKPTPELTSAPYAVGDYYNDGKKEGVVFEVWDDGNSGKIVSMTQSASALQWSSDEAEQKRFVGANSETDGAVNMAIIKAISGWESKYPAFKWCADLGEGWYLPAKQELLTICNNKDLINANLTQQLLDRWYWSSTEYDYHNSDGVFCAWYVRMGDGRTSYNLKSYDVYVRAVSAF